MVGSGQILNIALFSMRLTTISRLRRILKNQKSSPTCLSKPVKFLILIKFNFIVSNCSLLLDIYPPFSVEVQNKRKMQLQSIGTSFGGGFKAKLKALTSFSKWKSGKSKGKEHADDEMAQKLWDDSMSILATSMDELVIHEKPECAFTYEAQGEEAAVDNEGPRSSGFGIFRSTSKSKKNRPGQSPLAGSMFASPNIV